MEVCFFAYDGVAVGRTAMPISVHLPRHKSLARLQIEWHSTEVLCLCKTVVGIPINMR